MEDQLGGNTEDLLALGQPHPAERGLDLDKRDEATRRTGRRCSIAGASILSLLYIVCLSMAVASDNSMATSSDAELFYVLAMMTATIAGSILLSSGLTERRERTTRAMLRLLVAERDQTHARLGRMEEGIGQVAVHLPDALQLQNWKGYAASERNHLDAETGTDGTKARPPYLGLVPRNRGPERS